MKHSSDDTQRVPVIAIDFDGTIAEHAYFPDIGDPVPEAFEYMRKFQEMGARLILWTMRSPNNRGDDALNPAVDFCRRRGVTFWGINHNPDQWWSDSPKAYADLLIDDSAVGCPLIHPPGRRPYVDWSVAGPFVMQWLANRGGKPQ